jgi:hypothetical protein
VLAYFRGTAHAPIDMLAITASRYKYVHLPARTQLECSHLLGFLLLVLLLSLFIVLLLIPLLPTPMMQCAPGYAAYPLCTDPCTPVSLGLAHLQSTFVGVMLKGWR